MSWFFLNSETCKVSAIMFLKGKHVGVSGIVEMLNWT